MTTLRCCFFITGVIDFLKDSKSILLPLHPFKKYRNEQLHYFTYHCRLFRPAAADRLHYGEKGIGQRGLFPGQPQISLVHRCPGYDRYFHIRRYLRIGSGDGKGNGYDLHADGFRVFLWLYHRSQSTAPALLPTESYLHIHLSGEPDGQQSLQNRRLFLFAF